MGSPSHRDVSELTMELSQDQHSANKFREQSELEQTDLAQIHEIPDGTAQDWSHTLIQKPSRQSSRLEADSTETTKANSQLPNEIVTLIFEALWVMRASDHPAREHMAIPPSPGIIFQPFRLVSRTWNKLALPFIVRWWSRASPERILDFVKRHDVGSAVRHINIKTWTEIEHDPDIPLREDLWRETIVRCDSLESITIRIDRLERDEARDEAAGPGTKTWRWQQFLVDLFRNTMTVQQRRRVRKLNLQFHVDLVAVSVGLLADFATALPEVTTLIVQGYGTLPHQPGQVTIGLSSERTPPPTAMPAADQLRLTRLWTKVQHMVLLHIYSPWFNQVVTADNLMDWPGHSALSSLVQSSASALRSVEIDHVHHNNPPFGGCAVSAMFGIHDFEDALKNIRTSNHGQVLDDAQSVPPGHTLYPNLKAFTHRRCKPPLKQPTLFDYMPALEKLALEVRDVQNRSPVPEHWVECMPFQLTHLSLEFDNLNGWPDALMNLVSDRADSVGHERSNLKYLAIEPMAPNPEFAMLEGFVTTLLHRAMPHVLDDGQPGDLDLDDLRAIANVCERAGVFFACSDERLLVGDFWDGACHSDTVGDESEAMQVDGVDKVESGDGDDSSLDDDESSIDYEEDIGDVDVEDDYCWFEWWSDAKKRRMATETYFDAIRNQLRPDVDIEQFENAISPLLNKIEHPTDQDLQHGA